MNRRLLSTSLWSSASGGDIVLDLLCRQSKSSHLDVGEGDHLRGAALRRYHESNSKKFLAGCGRATKEAFDGVSISGKLAK